MKEIIDKGFLFLESLEVFLTRHIHQLSIFFQCTYQYIYTIDRSIDYKNDFFTFITY